MVISILQDVKVNTNLWNDNWYLYLIQFDYEFINFKPSKINRTNYKKQIYRIPSNYPNMEYIYAKVNKTMACELIV